jgi:malonyl-ACP decarboxylase
VVQLRDGFVHPNPWLCDPIDGAPRLAGPKALDDAPRCAVSSAFGFGGFNSAVFWRTPR